MRRLVLATSATLLATVLAMPAMADVQNEDVVIALHSSGMTVKGSLICSSDPVTNMVPCTAFDTDEVLNNGSDVYLVVALASELAGLSCGLQYDSASSQGVDIFGWTLCADLEFPNSGPTGAWPAAGGGNRITWNAATNCQNTVVGDGVMAVAGSFYTFAYSADTFRITPNRNLMSGPEMTVANCSALETELDTLAVNPPYGWVDFGGGMGYNPCEPTPVETTTWGSLKKQYN